MVILVLVIVTRSNSARKGKNSLNTSARASPRESSMAAGEYDLENGYDDRLMPEDEFEFEDD